MTQHGSTYLYYCPAVDGGVVFKHLHLYERWVQQAREKGIDMDLLSFVPLPEYYSRHETLQSKKAEGHRVIPTPWRGKIASLSIIAYFVIAALLSGRLVVHVRKRPVVHLEYAKRIVGDRLKIVVDFEGDEVAELDYLRQQGRDISEEEILDKQTRQRRQLATADHVFVATATMRDTFAERFPEIDIVSKTTVLPIRFPTEMTYDTQRRNQYRDRIDAGDRLVYCYLGSASLEWQNVERTIEIAEALRERTIHDPLLLLLVPEQDHEIVRTYLDEYCVDESDYRLMEVQHEEVVGYLNAANLGVVLRDRHLMNRVTYPGKFIEYLAAGLPTLTTQVVLHADAVAENGCVVAVEDMHDTDTVLAAVDSLLSAGENQRAELAEWASEKLKTDSRGTAYVEALTEVAGHPSRS